MKGHPRLCPIYPESGMATTVPKYDPEFYCQFDIWSLIFLTSECESGQFGLLKRRSPMGPHNVHCRIRHSLNTETDKEISRIAIFSSAQEYEMIRRICQLRLVLIFFPFLGHRSECVLSGCICALIIHVKLFPYLKHALNESCNDENNISKFGEGRSEKGENRRSCHASDEIRDRMSSPWLSVWWRSYSGLTVGFDFEMEWQSRQISQPFVVFIHIKTLKLTEDSDKEDDFSSISMREKSTGNLCENVSEEETAEDGSLNHRRPGRELSVQLKLKKLFLYLYFYFILLPYPSLLYRIYSQQNEKDKSYDSRAPRSFDETKSF